jgi:formate/nitrite transporter FocA (FNT family)
MVIEIMTPAELITNVTFNATQLLQLSQAITSAQTHSLWAGLIIGCFVGAFGAMAGIWYRNRGAG